jgi:hypothetical protein
MKITQEDIDTIKRAKKIVMEIWEVSDWKSTLENDTRKAFDSMNDVLKQVEE